MTKFGLIRNSGIRRRVLLLALIPTLLVTLVLFVFSTRERLADARADLDHGAILQIEYLAVSAEYGLLSGNREALEQLGRPALNNPSITAVSFLDAEGLALSGPHRIALSTLAAGARQGRSPQNNGWIYYRPVLLSSVAVDDFRERSRLDPLVLGWVVLELNDALLRQREGEILLTGLLVSGAGLLLAIWLALTIGRTILRPVKQISRTVEQLQQDQLDARVTVEDGGELGELQRGINLLAARVQRNRDHLQSEVVKSTRELQVALDALELQNKRLDLARQRAEEANRTKDEFLARMSHELRTPLTSVLGFVGLLGKTPLDSQQQEYAQVIQRTSSLLLSLIDDLLDFSKLESNAIRLETIAFNLDDCIEEVLEMHLPAARQKGIELVFVPDPALPERVNGDPTRVFQVLSNLISNAIKFTHQGEVVVNLHSHSQGGTVTVEAEVRDTGIGISAEQQALLFQPFAQADTSITRRFGGSGLGLVITRRLVELMGGTLGLTSCPGIGTRVALTLTLEVVTSAPPARSLAGMPVVLYDRRPLSQRAIRRRLEYWGCQVTTVRTRRELIHALEQSDQRCRHLILSLSGRELKALQHSQLLGSMRTLFRGEVILVSGKSSADMHAQYPQLIAQLQPRSILRKPLSGHALVRALKGETAPLPPPPALRAETQELAGLHILIAEDNRFNQLLISRMLELHGASTAIAGDGAEAIAMLQQLPVDLVLMDIHMPVMNGIEACQAIRRLPGPEARIPIISLTASTAAGDQQALQPLAIEANLTKPIDEERLVLAVRRACLETPRPEPPLNRSDDRLARYGISDDSLSNELRLQVDALNRAFAANDSARMRDHSHQLMGLAGLLGLAELDQTALAFNHAVKKEDQAAVAQHLERLQQLIEP